MGFAPVVMRELIFGEGLWAPTLSGDKQFSVRKFRKEAHDFKEGELILGKFKDGLNMLLQATRDSKIAPFKHLRNPRKNFKEAGYYFDELYFEELKIYYPDLTWEDTGAVVFYEILKINGVPVVALNEFFK